MAIESIARIDHRPLDPAGIDHDAATIGAEPFEYPAHETSALADARRSRSAQTGELEAWSRSFVRPVGRTRVLGLLADMTHAIRSDFAYELRREGPPQSPQNTLEIRRGSCRDFALLQVEASRRLGLAAQFVTGYVYSGSAKETGPGHGHTHAWARVYVPACGWVDLDPTNGIVGSAGLIRVAMASDPGLVVPLHGSWRGFKADFLGMDVEVEIRAEPTVSQPVLPSGVALTG
jgi:transglutaminase-like putative cysteine protease